MCALCDNDTGAEAAEAAAAAQSMAAPSVVAADYIYMVVLLVTCLIGAPANIAAICSSLKAYRAARRRLTVRTTFLYYKIHLCASNLLVLLVYVPTTFGWLITYKWLAGDCACRLLNYVFMLSFNSSSNLVAVIALDRASVVRQLMTADKEQRANTCDAEHNDTLLIYGGIHAPQSSVVDASLPSSPSPQRKGRSRTATLASIQGMGDRSSTTMALIAWLLAALCALPQLAVWRTYQVEDAWLQCTTVYMEHMAETEHAMKMNETLPVARHWLSMSAYQVLHLVVVFWLPFVLIAVCYCYMAVVLLRYNCRPYTLTAMSNVRAYNSATSEQQHSAICVSPAQRRSKCAMDGDVAVVWNGPTASAQSAAVMQIRCSVPAVTFAPAGGNAPPRRLPRWRRHLRSKIFRTTLLVIATFCLTWMPYNFIQTIGMLNTDMGEYFADTIEFVNALVLVNAVVNPFLYGFDSTLS